MSLSLATSPLQIRKGKTKQFSIYKTAPIESLLQTYMKQDAYIVCWQIQRIIWGEWKQSQVTLSDGSELNENKLLEIRIFNEKEELHLIRQQGCYIGRYLIDNCGEDSTYVDSLSRFWGIKEKSADGYVTLRDAERFLTLTIPCQDIQAQYFGLVTRNYIVADDLTGQAGYCDYRFVRIVPAEGGE